MGQASRLEGKPRRALQAVLGNRRGHLGPRVVTDGWRGHKDARFGRVPQPLCATRYPSRQRRSGQHVHQQEPAWGPDTQVWPESQVLGDYPPPAQLAKFDNVARVFGSKLRTQMA
jgi:hypothetical protein